MNLILWMVPIVLLGGRASANAPKVQMEDFKAQIAAEREFAPVYERYLRLTRQHGAQGLKTIITPNFTFHYEELRLKGRKAIAELGKYLDDFPDKEISKVALTIRHVDLRGSRAVVLTSEHIVYTFPEGSSSADFHWKQTWHKTTQGWKLSRWEKPPKKYPSAVTLTLTSVNPGAHSQDTR